MGAAGRNTAQFSQKFRFLFSLLDIFMCTVENFRFQPHMIAHPAPPSPTHFSDDCQIHIFLSIHAEPLSAHTTASHYWALFCLIRYWYVSWGIGQRRATPAGCCGPGAADLCHVLRQRSQPTAFSAGDQHGDQVLYRAIRRHELSEFSPKLPYLTHAASF